MFNPLNNTFQQWAVPVPGAGPWDVAIDHNGNVWFTERYTNKIGRFDPASQTFFEVSTPVANSNPYGIVVDASDNVWFTENNPAVALIGEYTSGGQLHEYKIRNNVPNSLTPHLITVDPNGNIWWTEGWVGMIAELKVAQAVPGTNNGVTEYAYQKVCASCIEHTSGIGVDGNGLVWFDDAEQGIFGSFPDSGAGSFATYTAPAATGHPYDGLTIDGQNRIWFDEEFANKLAVAIQSSVPTPTPTSTAGMTPTPTQTPTLPPVSGPVSKVWYFAEGRVGAGFNEFLTLGNPTGNPCQVNLTYLTQPDSGTGGTKTFSFSVPASTRVTRWVDSDLGTSTSGHGISDAATITVDTATTPNCQRYRGGASHVLQRAGDQQRQRCARRHPYQHHLLLCRYGRRHTSRWGQRLVLPAHPQSWHRHRQRHGHLLCRWRARSARRAWPWLRAVAAPSSPRRRSPPCRPGSRWCSPPASPW